MSGQLTMEKYPDKIRRVIYLDKESKKKFIFFTNALTISPVMVAKLYHNRWQIELFFQVDQATSEDKKVLGYVRKRSPHSDLLCNYSLLYDGHSAEKDNIERPIYDMLQIVSVSLTDTTTLGDLFAKPNYNIVNELDGSTEPSLF